jgi:hypothetical protein
MEERWAIAKGIINSELEESHLPPASAEIAATMESLRAKLSEANSQTLADLNHLIWGLTYFRDDVFQEFLEPDEEDESEALNESLEADIIIRLQHPQVNTGMVIIIQDCIYELDVAMAVSRICKSMPEDEYERSDLFLISLYKALSASDLPCGDIFLAAESHVIGGSVAHEIEIDLREDKSKAADIYGATVRPWINFQTFEGLEIDCWADEALVLFEAMTEDAKSTRH